MTGPSFVYMLILCGVVWGGFLFCLWLNFTGRRPLGKGWKK